MRRFVVTSKSDLESKEIKHYIERYLTSAHLILDECDPELVITVGGDGTFLKAVHKYIHLLNKTAFIGVHTGHLGFYADWLPDDIEKMVSAIVEGAYHISEYPLLEAKVFKNKETECLRFLSLNETTVRKSEGSIVMDVHINDAHFECFRGDGLCISTPSGSTAYNKGLGGAIIHPSLAAMQLTEMASINNRVYRTISAPLILPNHHVLTLNRVNEEEHYIMTIDHMTKPIGQIDRFEFSVAKEKIKFARFQKMPFWKRVRDSFIKDER